ncbi:hypothetical protein ADUPG1_011200, partial [Aduncisulcus paluster]
MISSVPYLFISHFIPKPSAYLLKPLNLLKENSIKALFITFLFLFFSIIPTFCCFSSDVSLGPGIFDSFTNINSYSDHTYDDLSPFVEVKQTEVTFGAGSFKTLIEEEINGRFYTTCGTSSTCDDIVFDVELAALDGEFDLPCTSDDGKQLVTDIIGAEYLINLNSFYVCSTKIQNLDSIVALQQLTTLYLHSSSNNMEYGSSFLPLKALYRIRFASIRGNPDIKDYSVFFRSIAFCYGHISFQTGLSGYGVPLCRRENSNEFSDYLYSVWPVLTQGTDHMVKRILFNTCILNSVSFNGSNFGAEFNCSGDVDCPYATRNEIYDVDIGDISCSEISLQGVDADSNLVCFSIRDQYLRECIQSTCSIDPITLGGMIPLDRLRNTTCSSFSISSCSNSSSISSLLGLEYMQGIHTGLTSLNLSNYDLSQQEDDRLVVQILARAVDISYTNSEVTLGTGSGATWARIPHDVISIPNAEYVTATYSLHTGLTTLILNNCSISRIEDVLGIFPIAKVDDDPSEETSGDTATQPFKLTSLSLSNNNITDVSVLVTSGFFERDTLTSLILDANPICDHQNVITYLNTYFTNVTSVSLSSPDSCPCSSVPSFLDHFRCVLDESNSPEITCWKGYYYDRDRRECVDVSEAKIVFDATTQTCVEQSISSWDPLRCQVCERAGKASLLGSQGIECVAYADMFGTVSGCPTYEGTQCTSSTNGSCSGTTCSCQSGYVGNACQFVYIPDDNLRTSICSALCHESYCNDITPTELSLLTSISASNVDSLVGLSFATGLLSLSIDGSLSTSKEYSTSDLRILPPLLTSLSLTNIKIDANIDFGDSQVTLSHCTILNLMDTTGLVLSTANLDSLNIVTLVLDNSEITNVDLYYLKDLASLYNLSINSNELSDLSLLYLSSITYLSA